MAFQTLILWLSMFNASFTSNLKIPAHQQFYLGPTEKVRNASDARRQGEAVYEYREPWATKQMMYFWLTKCFAH